MELEHRFDLPVGIDQAWATLTDMPTVAECFPGAVLDSSDAGKFSGHVKFKAGPARLTYRGTARFTDRDDLAHTATVEATGAESAAGTAAVVVTAQAIALAPNSTRVDLVTTLSLTGRPAQFGRALMVAIGNQHISQFADAVSTKLVGRGTGGAELVDVENPDEIAAEREQALSAPVRVPSNRPSSLAAKPTPSKAAQLLTTVLPAVLVAVGAVLLRKLFRSNKDTHEQDTRDQDTQPDE